MKTLFFVLLFSFFSIHALNAQEFGITGLLEQRNIYYVDNDLGEKINLDNGGLSFHVTDVNLPGNSNLPVRIGRRIGDVTVNIRSRIGGLKLGDWYLDIPMISGVANPGDVAKPGPRDNGWRGLHMLIPGEPQKTLNRTISSNLDGQRGYNYVTNDHWVVTRTVTNGKPSLIAVSPSGHKYFFNYEVWEADDKGRGVLAATRIEDIDGNWVTYAYSGSKDSSRVNSIASNDGRKITFDYALPVAPSIVPHLISTTVNGRVWKYEYLEHDLHKVILPDGRYWEYTNIPQISSSSCGANVTKSTTIKTPSGNVVEYVLGNIVNGRVIPNGMATLDNYESPFVATSCGKKPLTYRSSGSLSTSFTTAWMSLSTKSVAVLSKTITTTSYDTYQWQYDYEQDFGAFRTTTALPLTKKRTITKPDGTKKILSIYRVTDWRQGLVANVEIQDQHGAMLEKTMNTHQRGAEISNPIQIGVTWYAYYLERSREVLLTQKTITRGADIYTTQFTHKSNPTLTTYNFGMPHITKEFSSVQPQQKISQTDYNHDLTNWVLNRPTKSILNNKVVDEYVYDSKSRIVTHKNFGRRVGTYGYYNSGTNAGSIYTYKDALNRQATYSNYKGGKPQTIIRNDGAIIKQTVDSNGWVTSVTDAKGDKINYGYNSVGWLTVIDPLDSRWSNTTISYTTTNGSDGFTYVEAGMLKKTMSKGNYRKVTYYDSLLRPRMTKEWDTARETETKRYIRTNYDSQNRPTYQSNTNGLNNTPYGITTSYDGLGRPKVVDDNTTSGNIRQHQL
jgi:hypothetical protein